MSGGEWEWCQRSTAGGSCSEEEVAPGPVAQAVKVRVRWTGVMRAYRRGNAVRRRLVAWTADSWKWAGR